MAYINLPADFNSNQTSFGTAENIQSVVDSVETGFVTLNASVGTAAKIVTNLVIANLKDASGANGNMFVQDSSLYLKTGGVWHHVLCASLVL